MKQFFLLLFICLIPTTSAASICESAWDVEKIIASFGNSPRDRRINLRSKGAGAAEVTVGQVQAFHEAKQRISQVAGIHPTFIICGDTNVNAFAGQGKSGQIVGVTVGMLRVANGDPNLAAAVIGHEYAHHLKGHGAAAQSRDAVLNLLGLVVGIALESKIQQRTGLVGMGVDLGQLGSNLIGRKFDRDQEREADQVGFEYMVRAGFNPTGAIELASRMNRIAGGGLGIFFESHPGWTEREAHFRTLLSESAEAQRIAAISLPRTEATATSVTPIVEPIALAPTYETTDAQKSYADGIAAIRRREIVNGVREIRSAAEAGYAPAQSAVGHLYLRGLYGLQKDANEARRLFALSADQGDSNGQVNLGVMHARGDGGLPKSESEAARLYKLSADQGNPAAQSNLASFYVAGRGGLPKDEVEALRLLQLSAGQGHPGGQSGLAFMHLGGRGGLSKNEAEAERLYKLAVEKGYAQAQSDLGNMYMNGAGTVAKNETEAVRLIRLAALQGHASGQANLGLAYINGRGGLNKDFNEAARLFRLSAEQGNPVGQSNLGVMYVNGMGGLPKDEVEGARLYKLAADQNFPLGQFNLGRMYELGRGGLSADLETAVSFYRNAATRGLPQAVAALKRLGRD